MASLIDSNDGRVRAELDIILNKRLGVGLK